MFKGVIDASVYRGCGVYRIFKGRLNNLVCRKRNLDEGKC